MGRDLCGNVSVLSYSIVKLLYSNLCQYWVGLLLVVLLTAQDTCSSANIFNILTEKNLTILHTYNSRSHSVNLRRRVRRDETENIGRAYGRGRGIGYFVGEPCKERCNSILFHVYCNQTTHQCECLQEYPVNLDNRICVKGLRLGAKCEHHASCKYHDIHSHCHPIEEKCRCEEGYFPKIEDHTGLSCFPGKGIYGVVISAELTTMLSAALGLIAFAVLFFAALRMFGKARFGTHPGDRYADAGAPPPPSVILTNLDHLRSGLSSNQSVSNEFLPPSRRASYTMLAPPVSNLGSRRQSTSSVQSSLRSFSSFRSQSSFRNYRSNYTLGQQQQHQHSSGQRGKAFPSPATTPLGTIDKDLMSSGTHSNPNRSLSRSSHKKEECYVHPSSGHLNPSVPPRT